MTLTVVILTVSVNVSVRVGPLRSREKFWTEGGVKSGKWSSTLLASSDGIATSGLPFISDTVEERAERNVLDSAVPNLV